MSDKLGFFSNRICDQITNIFGAKTIDNKIFWGQNILARSMIDKGIYWRQNILMTKYINDKIYWRQTRLSYRWTQPQKVSLEFPPNPHRAKPTLDAFIGADWNGLSTWPPRFGMRHVRFSGSDCAGSSICPEIVINFSGHVPIEIQFSLNSKVACDHLKVFLSDLYLVWFMPALVIK